MVSTGWYCCFYRPIIATAVARHFGLPCSVCSWVRPLLSKTNPPPARSEEPFPHKLEATLLQRESTWIRAQNLSKVLFTTAGSAPNIIIQLPTWNAVERVRKIYSDNTTTVDGRRMHLTTNHPPTIRGVCG